MPGADSAPAGGPSLLDDDELILSHFSLGRFLPFEQRVAAASAAGFAGIGLYVGDYERLRAEGCTDQEMRSRLGDAGLWLVEIEALRGWSTTGPAFDAYRRTEASVFALSEALGPAGVVQVIGPYEGDLDHAAECFAGLCDRAADNGLAAAIEFLPEMSNIPDAATAWEIVRRAGRRNGGLCVDAWHHFRGAADDDMLRAVPADRIFTVQFDDGPRHRDDPDYYTDCTRYRRPPGEGEFDLVGFLTLLDDMGIRGPLSVEVLSTDLLRQPPAAVARRLAESTRSVLERARSVRDSRASGRLDPAQLL